MSTSRIAFPYEEKLIDNQLLVNPTAKITVKTIKGPRTIKFLVDSGADTTTLPYETYKDWFAIDRKKSTSLIGIEGKPIRAYAGKITLILGQKAVTVTCHFLESRAFPLLGRKDLWQDFNLTFDNKNRRTVLERI